ncbi:hydrolase [Amycolatopsis sp. WAC 01375]|uniref:amidohydrolase family protein n=1 Tax=unclassified Amycolatopsis TaxID=2618356 RepID=UPI000F77234F|nr:MULTISPECIES: amidohydrolase family protein [unclassified Amycolatopsis]RSM70159.1 hydrolase [Amycolatopsis sp. WAC 01375]RSN21327.1 hydrolase [Amycolatopsis sp. WAC 01416]
MIHGPASDAEIPDWISALGIDGLVDLHLHFLPKPVMDKVWAYFDQAEEHYGMAWPVYYRTSEEERIETLRSFGVRKFAPLVYPHKPGMAEWLTSWALEFAERVPDAVPTGTFYPEPSALSVVDGALRAGARCFKAHVQVGAYDPRDELLDGVWGALADAGVPVVVHCGHGPLKGAYTGLRLFEEILVRHPELTLVLAHAGMPEIDFAFELARKYPRVYLDTTMVGVDFTSRGNPLPPDWTDLLAEFPDRVVLGTDFPNIPYSYATQLQAIAGWAADDRLGEPFLRAVLHDTPAKLLSV